LLVTDSRQQTADILIAMADEDREPVSMDQWRALQTWIEGQPGKVYIPYAKELAGLIPPVAVRLRRDFMAVLQLIRAHAVLHQANREKDTRGRILATLDDYRIVRDLVAELVAQGVDATVSGSIRATVEAVRKLTAAEDADSEDGEKYTTSKNLEAALSLDKSAVSRRVKAALEDGYLKNLEEHKNRGRKLAIGEPLPADLEVLPTVESLAEKLGCWVAGGSGGYTPQAKMVILGCKTTNATQNNPTTQNKQTVTM